MPELVRPDPGDPWAARVRSLLEAVSPGRVATAAGAVLLVAVASWWLLRSPAPPVEASLPRAAPASSTVAAAAASAPSGELVVQAAGAVQQPGVYRVPSGSRVTDLLALAVASPDADVQSLALASLLQDGQRVWVPRVGEVVPGPAAGAGVGAAPSGPLDLNAATADQLDQLPGVGPATAQRILEHRARIGRFQRVEELLDVPGIGQAKLDALAGLVVVR